MTPSDFEFITKIIKDRSGLVLPPEKLYLLESRLTPLARKLGMKGLEDLIKEIRTHNDNALIKEVVDSMTTNESFFFRDGTPFEKFETVVLPEMLEKRKDTKKLRIWCAAASTGQEPYTLAMILDRNQSLIAGWDIEIIGTDISDEALERANSGTYTQFEVQRGLPIELLMKNFTQDKQRWRVNENLRERVRYKQFNLLDSFGTLGRFDIVFCRNVLIYFDEPSKEDILKRISEIMPKDGYLFLGATETIFGISKAFELIRGLRGIYRLAAPEA